MKCSIGERFLPWLSSYIRSACLFSINRGARESLCRSLIICQSHHLGFGLNHHVDIRFTMESKRTFHTPSANRSHFITYTEREKMEVARRGSTHYYAAVTSIHRVQTTIASQISTFIKPCSQVR